MLKTVKLRAALQIPQGSLNFRSTLPGWVWFLVGMAIVLAIAWWLKG
ncbi:MAG: hypothetical protein KME11_15725 [Timaviella obliquedivisa GSE-PSE-MK23-08B]|nr:hypothetical protein [Timaviella obliquedivisa GSE-PSE-MK23-08B]